MAVSSSLFSNYSGMRLELTVELVSQSIESNTSVVSYLLKMIAVNSWDYASGSGLSNAPKLLVIDGTTVVNQNQSSYSVPAGGSFTLASGTRTITHNSDGTKSLTSNGSFTGHSSLGSASVSVSLALPTIPRASSISGSHTTRLLGETLGITIYRASTSFTHTLRYRIGVGNYINIATGVSTSHNWVLPNSIADSVPTSINASITLECITFNGSTEIGRSTSSLTATVPNNETFRPSATITSINAVDGLNGYYVQGKSKVNVITTGLSKFSATITQQRVTIDGLQYYGSSVTSGVIGKSGTVSIALRVTDSRGFFAEVTSSVIFQAYFSPRINSFTATRSPTDQDTNLSAAVNFEIANVSNQNSRLYRIRYRVSGGSWSTLFTSTSYYSRVFTHTSNGILDGNNSYEVELFVQDSYSSATQILTVTTAFELINYHASGKGIAFGKVSEKNAFEVALPFEIDGVDIKTWVLKNPGTYYTVVPNLNNFVSGDSGLVPTTSTNFPSGFGYSGWGYIETKQEYANGDNDLIQIMYPFRGAGTFVYRTKSNTGVWISWTPIGGGSTVSWSNISEIPTTASRWPTWSEVTSKPSTFSPSSHSHAAGDLPNNYVALWSGTLRSPNTATLSQSYTNFDFIILTYSLSTNTTQSYGSYCVPVAQIVNMDGQFGGLTWYGGSSYSTSIFGWFNGGFTSNTTVKVLSSSSTSRVAFTGIYGVKIT